MEKSSNNKKSLIEKILVGLLLLTQTILSTILVVALMNTGVADLLIVVLVAVVLVILIALNAIFLFVRKNTSLIGKITCVVIAIICIVGSILALRYVNSFNSFLDKITTREPEVKSYSVAVLGESAIRDVHGLQNRSAGFLKTDLSAAVAAETLQKAVRVETDYYSDVSTMFDVLKANMTEAIVLESSRFDILEESENESIAEMAKSLRIIYSYEVTIDDTAVKSDKEVTTEPFILYISGSDSRNGIKATAGSDVNILMVVNPNTSKILLVSIPRDSYVQLHGTTGLKDKLTHAGLYGINMSKTTIEDLLGITIDYTLKVSFDTVVRVVDQLDGIDIYSDTEMSLKIGSKNKMCYYTVGTQTVDGDCALCFARERKMYYTGDIHRGENQQEVLTGIINKLSSSKEYLFKAPEILEIAADSFETSLTRDDITKFIRMQLAESIKWQIQSVGVSGTWSHEPTYSIGEGIPLTVMFPSSESIESTASLIDEYLQA